MVCYSQSTIKLGKYELQPHKYKGRILYNNLKVFNNVVATEKGITSLAYFPQTPFQTQHNSLGLKLIKTEFENTTIKTIFSLNNGNLPAKKIYQGNNKLIHRNNIFMYFEDQYRNTVFREIVIPNSNYKPYVNDYKVPENIDFNENGNIQTYKVNEISIGNEIGAFMGTREGDGKKFLFVHQFIKENPYKKYDFLSNSNSFKQVQNTIFFNGVINTKNGVKYLRNEVVWLDKIFNTDRARVAFFRTNDLDVLIPVKLNKSGSLKVFSDTLLKSNSKRKTKYSTAKERISGIHYMPYSGGFLNHYYGSNLNPNDVTIELYSTDFEKKLKVTIKEFQVKHTIEYDNFIILGGYTESKGYVGFANPKVVVIDKTTKQITYEKTIPLKNHQVDFMNLTLNNGEILISIGSPCCKSNYDTDKNLSPQIIIDNLQSNGTFENDLFN